ncbi:MAG: DNA-3-methyladenine glycosylase family protein [Candidatus Saccharimonadales bacterium]
MTAWTSQLKLAANHLLANDAVLAPIIKAHGLCTIEPHSNYYHELVDSIISQQLSIKAAATIAGRFRDLFGGKFPSPEEILTKDTEELRTVGLSRAKATYVRDLAQHIIDGELDIENLPHLSNEEIIRELTAVKGIGEWTAHMFLMFSLGRLDVLAVGDLGIRNGVMRLYGLPTLPDASGVRAIALQNNWHPYETIACWYVWKSQDNAPLSAE